MAALTPLQSITLNSSQSTVTFSNIDQTYTDLRLVVSPFSSVNGMNYSCQVGNMSANGGVDTGSNYSFTNFRSGPSGSAAAGGRSSNLTFFNNLNQGVHTTYPHVYKYDFMNYSNSTQYKNLLCRFDENDGGSGYLATSTGTWRSTNPINTITLTAISGTFTAGSTFSLYGIRSGGTSKASGGDIVVSDGTYWYHAFLRSNSFTPVNSLTADILVVAGGAGGGGSSGGGGGAGGVISFTSQALAGGTPYTCVVGAGGLNSTGYFSVAGLNGGNSQFGLLTPAIGGGGGGGNGVPALSGGSGGGGSATGSNLSGGSSTQTSTGGTSYGNAGGSGSASGPYGYTGGGGGGAGNNGQGGNAGGAGGAGINSISWSGGTLANALSATGLGVSGYIAGGGTGGAQYGSGSYSGGSGGGGTGGSRNVAGGNATAYTGSGGGAGGTGNIGAPGGNGAGGFIIVRYSV